MRPPRPNGPRTARRPALALAAAFGLAGCGPDTNVSRIYPDIALAPAALDFGNVVVGDESTLVLQVANAGDGPLSVSSILLEDDSLAGPAGVYTVTPPSLEVPAGESSSVLLTFEPDDYVAYGTNLVLGTNDPQDAIVFVPVDGVGVDGGPDLEVEPAALDFGTVAAGSLATDVFTVRNVGDAPLHIEPDSQQAGSGAFSLLTDPRGEVLEVGGSFTVLVQYAPTTDLGDQGSLSLASDDPDDPLVDVAFIGNGGGEDSYPVAIIDAYSRATPGEIMILDGTSSYDPDGNIPLSYSWSLLESPASSSAVISNTALSAPFMSLDVSGTYVVALQVQNTVGVSSSVTVHTIQVQPEDQLSVELTWNTEDADLDLHLVANDAAAFFDGSDDCCWCNPNPDWGQAGQSSDDPLLATDADADGGPELITFADPPEGEYFARVHYYQDNGAGTTEATLKIFVGGELAGSWSRDLGHNDVWEVAYVRWPQGYVIEEDGAPFDSPDRYCGL